MAKLHTATLLTVCVFFLLFNNEVLAQQECTTDNANYIDLENDAYSCATQSSVLCEDKSQVILSCPVLCTSCGVIEGAEGICADRMIDCDDLAINGICDSEDAYTHCRLTCGGCSVLS